jgi:hypothetical protein
MSADAPDPVELFQECLLHPEPLFDEYYNNERLIISTSPSSEPTPIMTTNAEIISRLTAAAVALKDKKEDTYNEQLEKIRDLLTEDDANYIEFTSFWPCIDVSFSSYDRLDPSEKMQFLEKVVKIYLAKRHGIYSSHGYSPTTIQVRKDFEKHKGSGSLGLRKAQMLLKKAGFCESERTDFLTTQKVYCSADRSYGTSLIRELKADYGMDFSWQAGHQHKCPDVILCSTTKHIFIVEMKHMKEAGGGQDKQMAELISFIKNEERNPNISFIAFLDGVYFNELISPSGGKIKEQKKQILEYLEKNKKNPNYFVNTYGFYKLIASM